jgi:iron complex transport system substrate-binding protein
MLPVVLFVLSLLLAAPAGGFEITDALDRRVAFDKPPERIVVAGRGLLMVADALYLFPEARDRVVALEKITLGKGGFLEIVDPGFDRKEQLSIDVGAERIASVNPDAVLMKSFMRRKLGSSLETLGIPVVYLDFETPEQYVRDLRVLGRLLGNEERAEYLVDFYRSRVGLVERRVMQIAQNERPETLFIYYSERGGSRAFNVPPPTWMQTVLVELAGGRAVWKSIKTGRGWTTVSFEQIAAWDAECIVVTSYFSDVDTVRERLLSDPLWSSLRAVRTGRLYTMPTDYYNWDLPDPRWILGLIWLATKLHPEHFLDIQLMDEVRHFFQDLYLIDNEGYDRYIRTVLGGDIPR